MNFTTGGQNVTFEAGKIYNVNVEIKPQFMHTDLNPVAYNITLTITIADWVEENIDRSSNSCSNPLITGGRGALPPFYCKDTAN